MYMYCISTLHVWVMYVHTNKHTVPDGITAAVEPTRSDHSDVAHGIPYSYKGTRIHSLLQDRIFLKRTENNFL